MRTAMLKVLLPDVLIQSNRCVIFLKGMHMKPVLTTLIMGLTLGFPAWADAHHESVGGAKDHAAVSVALSEGQVKKVDKAQGKLTIKHGPLENLGMPGMTMVFRVQDPGWLDRVKPGDYIRFLADRVNGVYTVTTLEAVSP
jgi:Cu(I)/Ag(I) efflux system periplasmic protein CusF